MDNHRTLPPLNRIPRPASIRIHTMLGSIKIYDVSDWWISEGCLWMIGTNMNSSHEGRFSYPIVNMEHFNIDEYNSIGSNDE